MFRIFLTLSLGLSFNLSALAQPSTDALLEQSHKIVKQFGGSLKKELKTALKSEGPVKAIEVCSQVAPAIAANMSAQYKGVVRRTSLKVRNPANNPDRWELNVLLQFEKRLKAGEPANKMEFFQVVENNGSKTFRYMKAIPTGEVCLKCHGSKINPDIEAKLRALYPDDQARGFKAGDIRGAFSLSKQL